MKKIYLNLMEKNLFDGWFNFMEKLSLIVSTLWGRLSKSNNVNDWDVFIDMGSKVVNNIEFKLYDLDEVLVGLNEDSEINRACLEGLLKNYILLYRSLEAVRILFIYSNHSDMKKRLFKIQDIIEIRVKSINKDAWISILSHNTMYGSSKDDLINSPLITRFL